MFDLDYSDELKATLNKLSKKDRKRYFEVIKKMDEIINSDPETINHYKNLRYSYSDRKRVHIGEKFVLTFRVFIKENFILFVKFAHRDDIYK
ncbi:MAG: addiction module toxin RelE [Candidatus ainarchaeum sp.]|nr:addiction module toxin RelE [Candidatus ainarchaeum sp.]